MESREYDVMRALEDSHWWYRSLRSLVLGRIGEAGRILDAGCGTGGMMDALRGRDAVGIDFSESALSHARGRGLSRIARASAVALPFPEGSFDAVLSLDVIYHRAVPDDGAAVAECARVARPGGIVLIHVPAFACLSGAHDREVHGARRYTTGGIRRLVAAAGLEVRELTYRNLIALPFAAVRRLPGNLLRGRREGGGSDLRALPGWINSALTLAGRAETAFLDLSPLPAGLSVWCVARKPS
jgi:SAM-dependent methyltransferase